MIERTNAFKVGDQSFLTLEDAQRFELQQLLSSHAELQPSSDKINVKEISDWILELQDAILDILTTTKTSKPKARKIHGGMKARKAVSVTLPPTNR